MRGSVAHRKPRFAIAFTTLFFVPIMYSFLRKKPPVDHDELIEDEEHEALPG